MELIYLWCYDSINSSFQNLLNPDYQYIAIPANAMRNEFLEQCHDGGDLALMIDSITSRFENLLNPVYQYIAILVHTKGKEL